jgi:hypothetical protein
LTANAGRNAGNVVFSNALTDLTLIDQGRAFGAADAPSGGPRRIEIPQRLATTLRALDRQRLEAAVGQWLDSSQIRALLVRRDQLLERRPAGGRD